MKKGNGVAEAALIIFAKAPIPGQVKTRLCPPLTPDEAASLHGSFVLDAVERSRLPMLDRFLACDPSSAHVFFKIMEERQRVRLIDQEGEDLGARMSHACAGAFKNGYRRVLLVGSDLPTLQSSAYTQALDLLATHDVVLGPALDGGYYLIGLTRPMSDLFVGIPWSTSQVLALTQRKADALGLRTALLPPCRDVDTIDDLLALIETAGLEAQGPRQEGGRVQAGSSGPEHSASSLSHRTAGALHLIADRLRQRGLAG